MITLIVWAVLLGTIIATFANSSRDLLWVVPTVLICIIGMIEIISMVIRREY